MILHKPQTSNLKITSNQNNALQIATQKLNDILVEALQTQKPILLLLAGGSSLELLEGASAENLDSRVTIAPLDERYSENPDENNMAQIMRTDFYQRAHNNGAITIDTRVRAGETQTDLADRFNLALNNWFQKNPDGVVIATVGIGSDGHVSGMMPFPESPEKFLELFVDVDETKLVVAYDAVGKDPHPLRVTTTINLLKKIHKAVVYVVGENKRESVIKFMDSAAVTSKTPAVILKEIPAEVFLFTDLEV